MPSSIEWEFAKASNEAIPVGEAILLLLKDTEAQNGKIVDSSGGFEPPQIGELKLSIRAAAA